VPMESVPQKLRPIKAKLLGPALDFSSFRVCHSKAQHCHTKMLSCMTDGGGRLWLTGIPSESHRDLRKATALVDFAARATAQDR
jgi:hypothetical protein